jgi:hypothetical protein
MKILFEVLKKHFPGGSESGCNIRQVASNLKHRENIGYFTLMFS